MSIKITGASKLLRKLDDLAKKDARKAARKGATAAGRAMRDELKSHVPVDEGVLKKATDFKVVGRGNDVGAIAGANVAKLQPDESRPTNVDWLVEFGHTSLDGQVIPPNPYIRSNASAINKAGEAAYVPALKAAIDAAVS